MPVDVQQATTSDLPDVAKLAGELVRQHLAFDAKRFLHITDPERGYEAWFNEELRNPKALILCAKLDGKVVGYAYAREEPRDWNALLDKHCALHDIFVADSARQRGVAKQLLERVLTEMKARGAPRVVLHTAVQNLAAQKLFASVGFRQTMLELTREL